MAYIFIYSQLTRRVIHITGVNIFVQNVSYVSVPLFLVIYIYLLIVLHGCNNNDGAASLYTHTTCHVSLTAIELRKRRRPEANAVEAAPAYATAANATTTASTNHASTKRGFRRTVSSCEHSDAPHYGKGFCRPCYMVSRVMHPRKERKKIIAMSPRVLLVSRIFGRGFVDSAYNGCSGCRVLPLTCPFRVSPTHL